jgi:hypothetical protein
LTIDRKMQGGKKYIPGIPDYQEYPSRMETGYTHFIQKDP